jgi:hypothetical protein
MAVILLLYTRFFLRYLKMIGISRAKRTAGVAFVDPVRCTALVRDGLKVYFLTSDGRFEEVTSRFVGRRRRLCEPSYSMDAGRYPYWRVTIGLMTLRAKIAEAALDRKKSVA